MRMIGGRAGASYGETDPFSKPAKPAAVPMMDEWTGEGDPTPPTQPKADEGGPPEAVPAPPPPTMPPTRPRGPTAETPMGPGTFQLPGGPGASPFRTMDFYKNRFVSGPTQAAAIGAQPGGGVGQVPGGSPLGAAPTPPIDPELLRRLFGSLVGGL